MLMMINNGIRSSINKKAISFLHSQRGQLKILMASMHNYKNNISIFTSLMNLVKLLNRINRICPPTSFSCNRKLMFTTINDRKSLMLNIFIKYLPGFSNILTDTDYVNAEFMTRAYCIS